MSRLAPLRLVVWLPIVGVLMSSGLRAEDAQMDRVIQWADTTLAGAVAECRASGIAAAVISDGRVVFLKGYGRDGNRPVDSETTVFSLASIAKSFAATAVAQLLKTGRIHSLDDPANL